MFGGARSHQEAKERSVESKGQQCERDWLRKNPPPSFIVTGKGRATRSTLKLETLVATLALEELAIAFHSPL